MHYKPDPKKLAHTHSPLSKPALFLGWVLGAGHRWNKLYKVLDYDMLLKNQFQVLQIREVLIHKCEPQVYHYPLAAAREENLETFESQDWPSILEKLPRLDQIKNVGITKEQPPPSTLPKCKPPQPNRRNVF